MSRLPADKRVRDDAGVRDEEWVDPLLADLLGASVEDFCEGLPAPTRPRVRRAAVALLGELLRARAMSPGACSICGMACGPFGHWVWEGDRWCDDCARERALKYPGSGIPFLRVVTVMFSTRTPEQAESFPKSPRSQ